MIPGLSSTRWGRWLLRPRLEALLVLAFASMAALALSAALSTGGHVSMDSTQQLFEAQSGRSVSWNPPLMSALLAVSGAGDAAGAGVATAMFVALVGFAIWTAPILVALTSGFARVSLPALLACVLLVLNPVLIIYGGIVWKDVLFGASTALASALGLAALGSAVFGRRFVLALLAAAFVALLPLVRQQGWVVGPVLMCLPVLAMAWSDAVSRRVRIALSLTVLGAALVVHLVATNWSASVITDSDGKGLSVGFHSIQSFDLAGMEAFSREGPLVRLGAPPEVLAELQANYTPERIDFFDQSPRLSAFLSARKEVLAEDWRQALMAEPMAYLTHRREVMQSLLGIHPAGACLPVHLGVDGFDHQLDALGLVRGADVIDRQVYQLAKPLFGTPIFKHWGYAGLLVVLLGVVLIRRGGRTRIALVLVGGSIVLFYASFIPTAIACDFRYLFPAIPCLSVLATALFFGWTESNEWPEPQS